MLFRSIGDTGTTYLTSTDGNGGHRRYALQASLNYARKFGKHVMVAGIEAQNHASIHLHETLGFVTTGQMPQVGTKFGRWLDLTFMQLQLDERSDPDAI